MLCGSTVENTDAGFRPVRSGLSGEMPGPPGTGGFPLIPNKILLTAVWWGQELMFPVFSIGVGIISSQVEDT